MFRSLPTLTILKRRSRERDDYDAVHGLARNEVPRCALPSPPSRRSAMRPIVNTSEVDRATDIGNMHKKIGKDRACGSGDILADRQTQRQT